MNPCFIVPPVQNAKKPWLHEGHEIVAFELGVPILMSKKLPSPTYHISNFVGFRVLYLNFGFDG